MAGRQLEFDGTATDVINLTATVADGEVVGGQTEFNNSAAGDRWPMARAVIDIADGFGGLPAGPIDLFMVRGDVEGTNNGTALGYAALTTTDNQTDPEYAEHLGAWHPNVNEAYRDTIDISLDGVSAARFYIQNNTGQTLVRTTNNITVSIEGFTDEPGT